MLLIKQTTGLWPAVHPSCLKQLSFYDAVNTSPLRFIELLRARETRHTARCQPETLREAGKIRSATAIILLSVLKPFKLTPCPEQEICLEHLSQDGLVTYIALFLCLLSVASSPMSLGIGIRHIIFVNKKSLTGN